MKLKRLTSGVLAAAMTLSLLAGPGGAVLPAQAAEGRARSNTLGDGLVLYSTFDDDARKGTTIKDLSGNGHDGTAVGALEYVAGKDGGKAVKITGQATAGGDTAAGDRYVDYGKSADIIPATGNFSISLWYQSTDASKNAALLSNKNFESGNNVGFAMGDFDNELRMNLTAASGGRKDINGSKTSTALGSAKTTKNTWHHLVVTVDRSAGTMSYYVNGTLADSGTADISGAAGSIDAGLNLVLGAGGNYCNATNNCLLDDLLIYDRVITTDEITLLSQKTAPDLTPIGLDEGLILDVDFEGSADDNSSNGYKGTVTGSGVTFVDGPFGKAVRIHNASTSKADSYISFGTDVMKRVGSNPFTLSLWYKADGNINNWGNFISNKDYADGKNPGLNLCIERMELGGIMSVVHKSGAWYEVKRFDMKQNEGGWHHIAATAVPGGNLTVYVDGKSVGAAALATGTMDTGLPLVLGVDGKLNYPVQNLLMDDLCIYGRALTSADVKTLYEEGAAAANAANAAIALANMRAAVEAVVPGVIYKEADKQSLLDKIDALISELDTLGADAINTRLAALEADYQSFLNGAEPLASFHLISDVHIGEASQTAANTVNYIAAMEDMAKLNPDTTIAFVNAGDNTNNGQAEEVSGFYTATKNNNPFTNEQTLILLGNHDVRGLAGANQANWNRDPNYPEKCVYWETAKSLYLTNNAPYMPAGWDGETLYHAKVLGGYTFLMLNTELGLKDAMYMSDEQLAWFEAEMKKAYEADPNKPVFIISHQALNDTHWLSNLLDGFDGILGDGTKQPYNTGKDAAVKEIMEKYPVGIFLSGHIHNGFGQASVIPRSYGVNVDVPSLNDSLSGVKDKGTGYEVMIYAGCVAFRARNFVTGEWLPEYDVVVPTGEHSYPRLIQRLEPAMSDLRYYSEADAAKLEDAFGGFWDLIDRYYDQSAAKWDSAVPTDGVLKFTPEELAEISAAADAAWDKIQVLDQVTRLDAPRGTVYDGLRARWRNYLLGGTGEDLDLSDPTIAAYVKSLNSRSASCWSSMVKGGSYSGYVFPDLDMTDRVSNTTTRSGNMGVTLQRLETLAAAWSTKGCDLYHNSRVRNEIISATDYVVDNFFKKGRFTNRGAYGNWYHWEITCPTALGNLTMMLHDELGADRVRRYAEAIQYYAPGCDVQGPNSPGPVMTGGNLLLKAYGVAQAGILLEDASMLENVRAGVKRTVSGYNDPDNLFSTGNEGDGFYQDGSYIQHQALPYIAGYGADLYANFSVFSLLLKGTDWEIKYAAGEEPLIYDFVFTGIEPFIAGSRTMDMVASRDITRSSRTDRVRTANLVSALLCMRGTFPTQEQNKRFDEMMKYLVMENPGAYSGSILAIQNAKDLLSDSSIQPRSNYRLTKTFAMDRTVHHTDGFALGIAMQSTRTFAHEIINNEGKRTWNIANGMVFLYDEDEDQYGGGFWCTVDPTRLPGTTAEHVILANGRGSLNANIYDWTGGSSIGNSGVAGMHMRALSRSDNPSSYSVGPRTGADMKKSWFMFGDRVLMLGSSITSNTGDHVETTVENRKINLDGSNTVTVDGGVKALSTDPAAPTVLENPGWMHLEGNVAGADIGYYFPEDITLQAMKDTRTGNWADQGTTTGTATNTYATFYVDHGVKPQDAGYAYVLLPGRSASQTAAYAARPDIEILQNDGSIHAARDNAQNITAANFWEAGSIDGISVDAPASVIVQRDGDVVTIGVSDPTQRDVPITVTMAAAGAVISKDGTVTVDESVRFIRFTVDTTESLGGTHVAAFRLEEAAQVELIDVLSRFDPVEVPFGQSFYELELPEKGRFLANNGEEYELELAWARGDYDANSIGSYTVIGTPVLPEGIYDPENLEIRLTVETAGQEVLASGDTYVNDGSSADKNFGSAGTLAVKLDAIGYQREALFQFDITSVPEGADSYTFQMTAGMDDLFQGGALYQVEDNWDPAAVTWNSKPAKVSETPVATFGRGDLENGILCLDITALIRQAQADGEETISLMIAATGTQHGKNQMNISSLESSAAQKPAILSEKRDTTPVQDKENLRFLLAFAGELDGTQFQNFNEAALDEAVSAGQAVYEDASATRSQVSAAEDGLMRVLLELRIIPE